MKNKYKYILVVIVFSFTSMYVEAQEKTFIQPASIIQLDTQVSTKSAGSIFKKQLNLNKENTYKLVKKRIDDIGTAHETFKQMYNGVPVEFGKATIGSKNGKNTSLYGEYYNVKNLSTTPKLSAAQALQEAMDHLKGEEYMWENASGSEAMNYSKPTGELLVLPNLDSEDENGVVTKFNLAYKFDMYVTKPIVTRGYLYIDAMTGAPLLYDAIIKHIGEHSNSSKNLKAVTHLNNFPSILEAVPVATANAATRYSGNRTITTRTLNGPYVLRDNTRGSGINTLNSGGTDQYPINDFTDSDNNWTAAEFNNTAKDNAALDAHWGAEMTYDYLSTVHNRNSFDGNGAAINSWVHYDDVPGGAGLDNAYWNGSVMSYGDGSSNGNQGNGNFDALTSLDVAAHEIGHAITTSTANLAYRRESGGLNEGFSDIWGAAVEHFAKGNGSNTAPSVKIWLIGDEIDRRNGGVALRSMSNPKALGQPDTYNGGYWIPATAAQGCATPIGDGSDPNYNDLCGVHTNSGVLNHWFYLTAVGSASTDGVNDNGDAFTVSGIGMDKAAKIAFRTLSVYLSANSTFQDTRNGAIQAAKDLYSAGSAEEQAVTNAWYAVGVGQAYTGGNTGGTNTSYCNSNGNNTSYFHIGRVQVGTINKTSGAASGGYADFTSVATQLGKGNSYTVSVTPTFAGTAYNQGYSVWVDYNQDGDFEDSGEQVFTQSPTTNSPVSGSFTVPVGATDGDTRMRVSMKYNGIATPCEAFSYGEVEDYTITIENASANTDTQAPSAPSALTASNVTETTLTLSWNASTDNVGVTGYDVYQGNSLLGTINATSADLTGLDADTTYSYSVRAKDAEGNISAVSNVLNVTTEAEANNNNNSGGGCTTGVSSFPYNNGFENTIGDWTQSSADDINWDINSNGTPSGGTGPSSANQGSDYIYVEASGGNTNKQAIIMSPCFDLSSVSQATFKFDYHMFGDAVSGSISLEASTNQGANWTSLWSETNDQGNSWKTVSIDLASYLGGGVQLRFNRTTGSTWKSDVAIDNVSITDSANNDSANTDPCDGVSPHNGATSYSVGDRVTYNGSLYELQASGWTNLGSCGAANSFTSFALVSGPPSSNDIRLYPMPVRDGKLNVQAPNPGVKNYTIFNLYGQRVDAGSMTIGIDVSSLEAGVYVLMVDSYNVQRFVVE